MKIGDGDHVLLRFNSNWYFKVGAAFLFSFVLGEIIAFITTLCFK